MTLKKLAALSVSAFLILISPGLGAYDAIAKTISAPQTAATGANLAVPGAALGLSPVAAPGAALNLAAPSLETSLPLLETALSAPAADASVSRVTPVSPVAGAGLNLDLRRRGGNTAAPAALKASKSAPKRTPVADSKAVGKALQGVYASVDAAASVGRAAPGSAHTMGVTLEDSLTGRASKSGAAALVPVAGRFGSARTGLLNRADGRYFAQPAGAESIAAAVNAADAEKLVGKEDIPGKYYGRTDFEGPAPVRFQFEINADGSYSFNWGTDGRFEGTWDYRESTFYGTHEVPGIGEVWMEIDFSDVRAWQLEAAEMVKLSVKTNLMGGESVLPVAMRKDVEHVAPTPRLSKGHTAPLPARIFATLIAALPAAVLGAPLILGGSIAGYLIAAASVGLMTMPFFGPKTSSLVRRAPGFALMALGAFTAGSAVVGLGLAALSTAPFWMGALVTLGGWGLVRFGGQPDKQYFDEEKVLTAFFGGLAAVTGVGLVALGVPGVLAAVGTVLPGVAASSWAGWALTGATWLSYPLAGMLLMHLPGWVGEGIGSAVGGLYRSVRGTLRTALSLHRDTIMRDRLATWTGKKLELNKWNFWKVAAVWAPILVAEAVMGAAAAAVGLALGAVQAPTMFLWGAVHDLWPESKLNKFLASWNRTVFFYAQGSKKAVYNRLAAPLIRAANAESMIKSWSAGAVLRLLQIGWLAYSLVATPFLYIGGFVKAFGGMNAEYDSKIHRPRSMRIDRDDSPVEKPKFDEEKPVSDVVPAGLIATALVGVPVFFFGLPLLGAPLIGAPYLALAAAIAAMPLLPAATPKWGRQVPGYAMAAFGILTMAAVPYMTLGPTGLAAAFQAFTSNAFWFGAVTALSGFGFAHNITKLAERKEGKVWNADDPEYIGAFLGSLGVLTGAGLAFAGVANGWLVALMAGSYLASGLLLMHLPKWFWTGVGNVFQGGFWSVKRWHKILDFWGEDTKFRKNMKEHADYYLDGSIWKIIGNSTWLSLIWVPTWLVMLAEGLLSVALGILTGLVRAPLNWAWGALYEMDEDAKVTRFFAGWARHTNEWVEGDVGRKRFFLRTLEALGLKGAMDENAGPSGRPSLKAVLAFVGARIVQLVWLAAWLGIVLPATLITGIFAGLKNAAGVKKQPDENGDEWYYDLDDPDSLF
jgi:hypothetical protein